MSLQTITQYIEERLVNVTMLDSFGYRLFFYGPEQKIPFVSYATADNEYENISDLDREGVYRVNIGISKDSYDKLLPVKDSAWDYTSLNNFMPHPHYAAQHFICILNPEDDLMTQTLRFIDEAYLIAKNRFEKKQQNRQNKDAAPDENF